MGQAVTCVALGVMPDKALWKEIHTKLEEVDDEGFSEGWKTGLKDEPNAESGMTDRMAVVGYVVALDGSAYSCPGARTEVPDLPLCASQETITKLLGAKHVKMAHRRWAAFSAWAEKNGVAMPEPEFIVTQVEIA